MKEKITNKNEFNAIVASIETTFRKEGVLETIKYKLIKTENNYKITATTNYYEEDDVEDTILFETKYQTVAVKMFAKVATNDIYEIYTHNNIKIRL